MRKSSKVDAAQAGTDKYAGQHSVRDILYKPREPKQHGKQEQSMDHARKPSFAAGFDVYDAPNAGAGARKAPDQGRPYVAYPLTDQFSVAVVMGLGEAVREQRAEQRVDCAKRGELNCGRHDEAGLVERQLRNDQCRQASGNGTDPWRVYAEHNRGRGYNNERY